jgi:lipopolysaccharide export system permease protein
MFDGMAQTLDQQSGRLSVTRFAEFSYDLGALLKGPGVSGPNADNLDTITLLTANEATAELTGQRLAVLLSEAHSRLSQPLLAIAGALLGFAALMTGGFSRFGLWRQIGAGVAAIIVVQFLSNYASSFAREDAANWAALYVPPAVGVAIAVGMLALSVRSRRVSARPVEGAVA